MLGALGVLPGESVDHGLMRATLLKVLDCWQYKQLWGWDFAMMAMTAARLGESGLAVDILLADSPKNT
jgi:hypothetical protein